MFRQKRRNNTDSVFGGVAHLVERYIRIVEVVSSSLIVSTSVPLDPIRPWVQRYFLPLRLDRKQHLFCYIFTKPQRRKSLGLY